MSEPTRDPDPLLAALRELPPPEQDGRRSERVRLRAQRVLTEERALAKTPALRPFARFFADTLLPAALVGTAGASLFLLLQAAANLYH
jgi:hypothetical protein